MLETFPSQALFGGILIGISAALLLAFNGRIAGISGILYNLVFNPLSSAERGWRIAFLVGLMAGGYFMLPVEFELRQGYSQWLLIASGLAVGIGTRIGNGCTSGHGVCGLSRGSVRSLVATATFMAAGFVTVFVQRHVLGG